MEAHRFGIDSRFNNSAGVALVRWPLDRERRDTLSVLGVPRLLLIEASQPLPEVIDPLEDWIRVPADGADIEARTATLAARVAMTEIEQPSIDDQGVLRFRGAWVSLPPVERTLADALIERCDAVVSRDTLATAAWPNRSEARNLLDVHVLRLRRKIEPLGLLIRTVRSRGYLLDSGLSRRIA